MSLRLNLLQLLGERVDLLHLVADHFDCLPDALDVHDFIEHVGDRVGDHVLSLRGRDRARGDENGYECFHGVIPECAECARWV